MKPRTEQEWEGVGKHRRLRERRWQTPKRWSCQRPSPKGTLATGPRPSNACRALVELGHATYLQLSQKDDRLLRGAERYSSAAPYKGLEYYAVQALLYPLIRELPWTYRLSDRHSFVWESLLSRHLFQGTNSQTASKELGSGVLQDLREAYAHGSNLLPSLSDPS